MQKSGSDYVDYTGSDIVIDSLTNELKISTVAAMAKQLYIQASTLSETSTPAHLPLSVTVIQALSTLKSIINLPPQLESLPENQVFENDFAMNPNPSFSYILPNAFDTPGDTITTSMEGLTSFMTFDPTTNTLTLSEVTEAQVGTYSLTIKVQDDLAAYNTYTFFVQIKATIPEQPPEEEAPTLDEDAARSRGGII
jgi:hypothetical protein